MGQYTRSGLTAVLAAISRPRDRMLLQRERAFDGQRLLAFSSIADQRSAGTVSSRWRRTNCRNERSRAVSLRSAPSWSQCSATRIETDSEKPSPIAPSSQRRKRTKAECTSAQLRNVEAVSSAAIACCRVHSAPTAANAIAEAAIRIEMRMSVTIWRLTPKFRGAHKA